MKRAIFALYGASFALHVALAGGVAAIPKEKKREVTAISLAEQKPKKKEEPKPPEPPKPPPESKADRQAAKKQSKSAEAKAEAPKPVANNNSAQPSAAFDGMPDFGLSMGGGLAVPVAGAGTGAPANEPAPASSAKKQTVQAPKPEDECTESVSKPKLKSKVQPAYPERAREAKVEGSVRIEVQVDSNGRVVSARVLSGLGHGLDEAALAAARQWTFEPAMRCGKPVAGTAVGPVSFRLPQ